MLSHPQEFIEHLMDAVGPEWKIEGAVSSLKEAEISVVDPNGHHWLLTMVRDELDV